MPRGEREGQSSRERGGGWRRDGWPAAWGGLLVVAAVVGLAAVVSCWTVGWVSDDWVLRRVYRKTWLLAQRDHLSLVDSFLWHLGFVFGSPLPVRLLAMGCHLLTLLIVFPRVIRGLFPRWEPATGLWVGVGVLSLSSCIEPLVWACAAPYALVGLLIMATVAAHLRWLEDEGRGWRFLSVATMALGLVTWEFAVAAAPLVVLTSWMRGRSALRSVRDGMPQLLLLLLYLGAKIAFGSTVTPALSGPVRLVGNILYTPLLTLSPVFFDRQFLLSPLAMLLATATLGALLLGALRSRTRTVPGCLVAAYVPLLPVLAASGPQQRYLYLAAPWMVLAAVAAVAESGLSPRTRRNFVSLAVVVALVGGANQWRFAADWKQAAAMADRTRTSIAVAVVDPAQPVVVLNAPDRLPGWGPTRKYWVWRLGLIDGMAERGIDVVALAHTLPFDSERLGAVPSSPVAGPDQIRQWQASGRLVVDCAGTDLCAVVPTR